MGGGIVAREIWIAAARKEQGMSFKRPPSAKDLLAGEDEHWPADIERVESGICQHV